MSEQQWTATMNEQTDKPRYGLIDALTKSFYSKDFYLDVAHRWRGKTIALGFILCALLAVDYGVRTMIGFSRNLIRDADIAARSIPDIEAKRGRIDGQSSAPVVITDPANNTNLLVIDLQNNLTSVAQAKSKYLLTKDRFYVKDDSDNEGQQDWDLNTFATDWKIRPVELPSLARQFAYAVSAIVAVALIVIMPTILLVNAAIIAGVVKLFRGQRTFWESVRLAVASVVPAAILGLLVDPFCALAGVADSVPDNAIRLVGLIYLFYAFKVTRKQPSTPASS